MAVLTGVIGKNKMDTRLVIASPRSGSTWFVLSYFPNRQNDLGEFFNKDWRYWIKRRNNDFCKDILEKLNSDTLADKINFLETERQQGREYFCKLFPSQIYNQEDHREWLYSFYENDAVCYLQRHNKWQQFLSYVYQSKTHWEDPNPTNSETIVDKKVICTEEDVNNWIEMNNRDNGLDMSKFKNVQYYSYEQLNRPSDTVKLSDYLDYEKLITNCEEYKWMIS